MNDSEKKRWEKILAFEIGDSTSDFSFTDRLARENGWSLVFTHRVIHEYKKFMFLICCSEHPLTPSDEVDQVWHLHLLYTESYWEEFCTQTLERKVNHGPTKGGSSERVKFTNWYEATKELYTKVFDQKPPKDIWPSNKIRFGYTNYTRINRHTNWVFPKPKFFRK